MTTAETTRSGLSSSGTSGSAPKEDLKADADRLKETAKSRASDEAEHRKSQATQTARSASSALEKAASELDQDQNAPDWLSSAFRQTAKGVEQFAGKVDSRSPEQMGREISRFARENPGSFLAASAAAGFAAARFLRAGADYRQDHQGYSDSYSQTGSDYRSSDSVSLAGSPATSRFASETEAAQQRYGESRGGMTQ